MGRLNEDFTELADFTLGSGSQNPPRLTHNVIKRRQVIRKGIQEVGMDEKHSEDPIVFLQRDGDKVTKVDFLCKCGRSASIRLEYEEE
jgi:hypothetical protein